MAEPPEQPLTESDLAAAITNFEFFVPRLKASSPFRTRCGRYNRSWARSASVAPFWPISTPRQRPSTRFLATAVDAQKRLDGIAAEIDRHLTETQAEAARITGAAHSTAARHRGRRSD